jgi:hypothetical protein
MRLIARNPRLIARDLRSDTPEPTGLVGRADFCGVSRNGPCGYPIALLRAVSRRGTGVGRSRSHVRARACRDEHLTGTRVATGICMTEQQIAEQERVSQQAAGFLEQARRSDCTGSKPGTAG